MNVKFVLAMPHIPVISVQKIFAACMGTEGQYYDWMQFASQIVHVVGTRNLPHVCILMSYTQACNMYHWSPLQKVFSFIVSYMLFLIFVAGWHMQNPPSHTC